MSIKSIKEKELLVNFAKSLGQEIDPRMVEEVERLNKIKAQIQESVKDNVFIDLSNAIKQQSQPVLVESNYPVPPSLDDLMNLMEEKETENELVQAQTTEEPTLTEETKTDTPADKPATLAEVTAKFISEAPKDSFQQPDPLPVPGNLAEIQKKLKFLEQWIGKVSMAGPGSGETRFRFLDDIRRETIDDTHKVLRYYPSQNPAYSKFGFGFLSGDQGPIYSMRYDTNGYTSNANVTAGLTAWNKTKDCLDIYQADGSVLQTGLENYIRVYNTSANTINQGTFVQFGGVYTDNEETPIAVPFVNDANAVPLYSIGVVTTTIGSNAAGRATVLGEVHGIDTSGNVSGESWNVGDLLWAKPGAPGKLTKVKPTAPNVVVSVAAVLKKDSTDGTLLVRPTIWPRLYYASFSDTTDQYAANVNTAYAITYNTVDIASGFEIGTPRSRVYARNSGLYNFQFSAQYVSTNSSAKDVYIWIRKNGQDIPNSASRKSITGNGVYDVLAWNFIVSMNANDYFELMWAANDTTIRLAAPGATSFCPAIPSVILTVTEVAL